MQAQTNLGTNNPRQRYEQESHSSSSSWVFPWRYSSSHFSIISKKILTSTKWMDLFPKKISYSGPVLCRSVLSNSATPRILACQVPLSMGILQARIPEWVATSSSRLRSYNCSYCVYKNLRRSWASQVVLLVKNLPANAGDTRDIREKVWSLGWEDPLVEDMATHSSILAWRIPWTRSLVGCSP